MLEPILAATRKRVEHLKENPVSAVNMGRRLSLEDAVRRSSPDTERRNNIIAEIKFRSPSAGTISGFREPSEIAAVYTSAGCCAVSVLTEPEFFGGDLSYIKAARKIAGVPVLRKDFIIDEIQLEETAASGADVVLLIAGVLDSSLGEFIEATGSLGLGTLVEVRTEAEAEAALSGGARVIGINNRNLSTMKIDPGATKRLAPSIMERGAAVVCESGISGPDDIRAMRDYCDAFLVGTRLMSSEDPGKALEELVCA